MQVFLVIIFVILGLIVQYFLIKAAVAGGIKEMYDELDLYNHSQRRRAVKEGIKEALSDDDNKLLKELQDMFKNAILEASQES
ncbi:MAG: hypothetical protein FWC73_01025 [Defluviitaleaceae bacterium]|nr:hypothetical protein [Defluviitaleaceae bacterium]